MAIIGAGPTGIIGALSATAQKAKVVVIDSTPAGSIPMGSGVLSADEYPAVTDFYTKDWRAALTQVAKQGKKDWKSVAASIQDTLATNYGKNTNAMASKGVSVLRGSSYVEGAGADKVWNVKVSGVDGAGDGVVKAKKILVTQSKSNPVAGVTYGGNKNGVFSGDTITTLDYLPASMAIVGTDLAALEYASAFAKLGSKVTLAIADKAQLTMEAARAGISEDVLAKTIKAVEKSGVSVVNDDAIASIQDSSNPSSSALSVTMTSGKAVSANAVLTMMGRSSIAEDLGLLEKTVGTACNADGKMLVDDNYETTATGIYAGGDAIGGPTEGGLDEVHKAISSAFGLTKMITKSMPERHATFLSRDVNAHGYASMMDKTFPGAIEEGAFIEYSTKMLASYGFNPKTSINLVSTCRDEICRPFTEKLDSIWGQSFNIASLGGMVFCGKTGFGAGMAHAPIVDGKERYVFWAAPHIAYGIQHIAGKVFRPGRDGPSSACGALIALNGEIAGSKIGVGLDPLDTEMSLLRQQVLGKLEYGQVPSLVGITYAAHDVILDQVKRTAEMAINPSKCEYVIISGIQIHGALGKNFFWPGSITMYNNGKETDLSGAYQEVIKGWNLDEFLQEEALSKVSSTQAGKVSRLPGLLARAI